jgi:hypothetical protein
MKNVYLMQVEGMDIYKIGNSKNPNSRVKGVQTGNPFKVIVLEFYPTKRATKVEAALHNRFASCKVTEDEMKLEGEWFRLNAEDRKNFKATCELIDNNFRVIEEMSTLYN